MEYTEEKYGDIIVVVVNLTRATLNEAKGFMQVLHNCIAKKWTKIIVDLSDCEFIDSTYLGALVISLKRVAEFKGDIRLVGFHPVVNSMFHLTRMDRVFETFKTKEEAIKSYKTRTFDLLQSYFPGASEFKKQVSTKFKDLGIFGTPPHPPGKP